ncbi:MAG: SMC family ATPase [Actinomycetaceae bacterium]|nr:SMC family ATPase [Actinomycetaceae bacterium]
MQLSFSALGPFPGKHTIDFTQFEASGLYLLRGATGAGKSSIIDAITFGLYGTVAGGRKTSSMERLRSNYADRQTATEVSLRFEVSAGIYEVVRRPSYLKEGNKHPTPSTAVLHKLTMSDETVVDRQPIATRVSDVDREIPRIIGVGEDQFLQTVVLPQGKFARFIQSGPTERKSVLEDIFRTQPFEEFTRRLREQAENSERRFSEQLSATTHCGLSLSQEIGDLCRAERFDDASTATAELLNDQIDEERALVSIETEALANLREVQLLLDESRAIEQERHKWAELKRRSDELDECADERQTQRQQIERAREAATVNLAIDAVEEARQMLEDRSACFETAALALSDEFRAQCGLPVETDRANTDVLLEELSSIDDDLSKQISTLDSALKREESLEKDRADRDQLTATIDSLTQARQPLASLIDAAPDALARRQQIIDENRASVRALPEAISTLNEINKRLELHDQADAERTKLIEIAADITRAVSDATRSKATYDNLYARWLTNSALILADNLSDDTPCPVCGSREHPDPITGDSFDVSFDEVNRAHEISTQDTDRLRDLRQQHKDANSRIADLNTRAGALRAVLEEQRETQQALVDSLHALDTQTADLEKELSEAREQLEESREQLTAIDIDLATHSARRQALEQTIADEETRLLQVRGTFDTVHGRLTHVSSHRVHIRAMMEATRQLETARRAAGDAQARLNSVLANSPFDSPDEARQASLTPDELATIESIVKNYDDAVTSTKARLTDAETSGLHRRNHARVDLLNATVQRVSDRCDDAHDRVVSHREFRRQLKQTAQSLSAHIRQLEQIDADSGPIRRLAQAARGASVEDGNRIPLGTWVLMTRFEDVLAASNPYLTQFSSGRYALRRTATDPGSRQSIGGLGLAVFDFETDVERAPTSLSGGETFYVSLALALGLVEVVSSEAGGIEFRSMIIDEGFGHLDQGTLDQVMQGLEQLRDTGRTVGIVSHVEEMHRRISDGIHVRRLAEGSTLSVVG